MAHNYLRQDQLFHRVLHLPVALAGVSEAVQSILTQQFGRSSLLIPNGVDCDRFFPGHPTDVLPSAILSSPTKAQVKPMSNLCYMWDVHDADIARLDWQLLYHLLEARLYQNSMRKVADWWRPNALPLGYVPSRCKISTLHVT